MKKAQGEHLGARIEIITITTDHNGGKIKVLVEAAASATTTNSGLSREDVFMETRAYVLFAVQPLEEKDGEDVPNGEEFIFEIPAEALRWVLKFVDQATAARRLIDPSAKGKAEGWS